MTTLTVNQFDGSLTDFYIGQAPNQYKKADNFILDEYKKLISRPGTVLDFTSSLARARAVASVSTRRIGLMFGQTTGSSRAFTIVKQVGATLQYDNGSALTELQGIGPASAFTLTTPVDATTAFSYAEWNNHTIVTHESPYQRPLKVFNNAAGTLSLVTAGLPPAASTFTATGGAGANYVYALVYKYSYSIGDVDYIDRSKPTFVDFTNIGTNVAAGAPGITVGSIPALANTAGAGELYDTATAVIEIYRTTNNGTTLYKVTEVANGTGSYVDNTSDDALILLETIYTTGGVVGNDRPPKCKYLHGTSDFVYYAHGIEVGSAGQDLDILPQRLWQSKRGDGDSVPTTFYADAEQPITGISSVKSIPVVFTKNAIYRADGSFDNQGRGGIVLKKISDSVGAVGHLSLVQTLEGIYFAGNDGFYFTDGYNVTPINERTKIQYAALITSDLKKKRICGAFDSVTKTIMWATSSDRNEYDDENSIFYVCDQQSKTLTTFSSGYQGGGLDVTQTGGTNVGAVVTIGDTTGIDVGSLVFRDDDQNPLQRGAYVISVDSSTQFTINYAATNASNKTYRFVTNLPENTFYRNMLPTAVLFADDKFWFGDRHGFTRRFDYLQPSDVWIDGSGLTNPVDFNILPIFYDYQSPALDLGTTEARKYVWQILTKARPRLDINAEMTLQVTGQNDDNGLMHDLLPIFFESFYPWGTPLLSYGDPRLWSARRSIIDVKRRFPASKLRCEYKQIEFTPGFVNLDKSRTTRLATIAAGPTAVTKEITLASGSWDSQAFNYWFSSETDGYILNYRIVERVSNSVIRVLDPAGTLATGASKKWVLRGFLKTALINLIEYTLFYEVLGASQQQYQGENTVTQ